MTESGMQVDRDFDEVDLPDKKAVTSSVLAGRFGKDKAGSIEQHAKLLLKAWFLQDADLPTRVRLAQFSEERSYAENETIGRQGDQPNGVHIVIHGKATAIAQVLSGGQASIFREDISAKEGSRHALGEMEVVSDESYTTSVVTQTPTTCLFVPRDAFIETVQSSRERTLRTTRSLLQRVQQREIRFAGFSTIIEALRSKLEPQKVCETLVKQVQELSGAGLVSFKILGEQQYQLPSMADQHFLAGAVTSQFLPGNVGLTVDFLQELEIKTLANSKHAIPITDRLSQNISGLTAICVPIMLEGQPTGVLTLVSVQPGTVAPNGETLPVGRTLLQEDIPFLRMLTAQVVTLLEHMRAHQKATKQASTDNLTGLFNHGAFQTHLASEIERARRTDAELALLFLDIDSFKSVNDTYGHEAGNQLLRVLTNDVLKPGLRQYDILGRYGGDEFAVILPNTTAKEAYLVADRLRRATRRYDYTQKELPPEIQGIISLSIGIGHFPMDAHESGALLQVADRGVYFAKFLGKNQVQRGRATAPMVGDDSTLLHGFLSAAGRHELEVFAAAIDARDTFTAGHSHRVANYVRWLAEALGHDEEFLERLHLKALFHDVGKAAVPDSILRKAGQLTVEEYERIKAHPIVGVEMIGQVSQLRDTIPTVRSHHERWDGSGYPDGLAGESIPYTARLLAIADAYDAMTSDRLYRSALLFQDIKRIFRSGAGISWEPSLVDMWCSVLEERSVNGAPPLQLTSSGRRDLEPKNRSRNGID